MTHQGDSDVYDFSSILLFRSLCNIFFGQISVLVLLMNKWIGSEQTKATEMMCCKIPIIDPIILISVEKKPTYHLSKMFAQNWCLYSFFNLPFLKSVPIFQKRWKVMSGQRLLIESKIPITLGNINLSSIYDVSPKLICQFPRLNTFSGHRPLQNSLPVFHLLFYY